MPTSTVTRWERRARVAAVIPAYNEHPDAIIRTIRSLYVGTRRPDVVYIIDDGSPDRAGIGDLLYRAACSPMDVRVLPVAANRGKRHAQAAAWADTKPGEFDVWLLIDSDTTVARDAVERMVRVFADPSVHAATSLILPRNRGHLPLLQEVEYARSMVVGRMALNWLRSVSVISGGYSAVRDRVVRRHLTTYLAGFWGVPSGDDRHLAILSNITGRVLIVPEARAYTDVPARWRDLLRQRTRWARSFFLGSAWTLVHVQMTRRLWWVVAAQMTSWCTALAMLVVVLAHVSRHPAAAAPYIAYVVVLSWLLAFRYLAEPHPHPLRQYTTWLLAPAQALLAMLVLMPVQLYALATCRRSTWGTRPTPTPALVTAGGI